VLSILGGSIREGTSSYALSLFVPLPHTRTERTCTLIQAISSSTLVRYEDGRLQCKLLKLPSQFLAYFDLVSTAVLCAPSKLLTRHNLLNFKKVNEFKISLLSASAQHLHMSDARPGATKVLHRDEAIADEIMRIVAGWKSQVGER